jgi:hypothetical protein
MDDLIDQLTVLVAEAKICLAVNRLDELSVALDTMSAMIDVYNGQDND